MTLPHLEEEKRKHGRYDLRQSEWASTVQNQIHPGLRGWPTGPCWATVSLLHWKHLVEGYC